LGGSPGIIRRSVGFPRCKLEAPEENVKQADRRSFLKIAGSALGVGVLYSAYPAARAGGSAGEFFNALGQANGEKVAPFSFIQPQRCARWFQRAPDPPGTKAFDRAVDMINGLPQRPDLILFTGDLTHDTEDRDVHVQRMKQFQEITKRINVPVIKHVPGEHDAGVDSGALYREVFGETYYSFDHRGSTLLRSIMSHARSLKSAPSNSLGSRRIWPASPRPLPLWCSLIGHSSICALTGSGLPVTAMM
jgi:hypothetical protein